jgi:hypothetical protein
MQRVGAEFLDLRAKRIDRARVARGRKLEFHIRTGPVDDANPFRVRGRPLHLAAFGLDQEAVRQFDGLGEEEASVKASARPVVGPCTLAVRFHVSIVVVLVDVGHRFTEPEQRQIEKMSAVDHQHAAARPRAIHVVTRDGRPPAGRSELAVKRNDTPKVILIQQFLEQESAGEKTKSITDGDERAVFLRDGAQLGGMVMARRDRLLDQNRLATLQDLLRNWVVRVVGCRQHHTVYVVQDVGEVPRRARVEPVHPGQGNRVLDTVVDERSNLDQRRTQRRRQVLHARNRAAAYEGQPDSIC